jgi:hypothetical protein
MFRSLFSHNQEALHTQQLVYFVSITSAGCCQGSRIPTLVAASRHNTHKQHMQIVGYAVPPDDEQVVLETCTGC